jgi:hypothetical protein
MTTIRMFAFFAAVLVTAFFLRVLADGLSAPPHEAATISQPSIAATPASSRSSVD